MKAKVYTRRVEINGLAIHQGRGAVVARSLEQEVAAVRPQPEIDKDPLGGLQAGQRVMGLL